MFLRAAAGFCLMSGFLFIGSGSVVAEEQVNAFTFTVTGAPKTGLAEDRLKATIRRWSTDEERDRVASLLSEKDSASLSYTLRNANAIGHLRWPGGLEYTLRYARRTPRPDGGADIVLVADSRVWVWWDQSQNIGAEEPFTVFHVRLGSNGTGEGRIAPASRISADKAAGLMVTDLDSRPALMTDVRPERTAEES